MTATKPTRHPWPDIPYPDWAETCTALHLWCQIVGKYRLAHTPWINHSWHATLYVTPEGVTTGPVHEDGGCFTVTLDFVRHKLIVTADGARQAEFDLRAMSVAEFHDACRDVIAGLGGTFDIHGAPNELPDVIPFAEDKQERPYDAEAVARFHAALLRIVPVFERFRTGFLGKSSPVHLFWGSFDLAVTRFSGRRAPLHPGGFPNLPDAVTQEAYSHEVMSAGFWPGGGGVDEPMFYAYGYPSPDGLAKRDVAPDSAYFHPDLQEHVLPYAAIRDAEDPAGDLLSFLQGAYGAIADLGDWDRATLDAPLGRVGVPRALDRE